jgi:hypothetical protein
MNKLEQAQADVARLVYENSLLQAMNSHHRTSELTFKIASLESIGKSFDNAQWSIKLLMSNLNHEDKEMMCRWLRYALDTATSITATSQTAQLTAEAQAYRLAQVTGATPPRKPRHTPPAAPVMSLEEVEL